MLPITSPMNTCSTTLFDSSVVDHVFIGGVMVKIFGSSVVDHVFIGGVMVNMFASSVIDHVLHVSHYTIDEHMIYHT
jgi:3-phosphoglycerate kinase